MPLVPCAAVFGDHRTSRCDNSHRQDLRFGVYLPSTGNPSNPIGTEDCKTNLRLPEEQSPPVETPTPEARKSENRSCAQTNLQSRSEVWRGPKQPLAQGDGRREAIIAHYIPS